MKLGIFGLGYWRELAAAIPRWLPDLRVERVWSRSAEKARVVVAEVRSASGADRAVARGPTDMDGLDLAVIATPPGVEPPLLRAAIERRLPSLVEKPVSLERAELARLVRLAEDARVPVAVNLQARFVPEMHALRTLVRGGHRGALREVEVVCLGNRGHASAPVPHGWQHRSEDGGGVIGASGPHAAELLLALAGPGAVVFRRAWTEVAARADGAGVARPCTAPDNAEILTEHAGGARGRLRLGTTSRKKEETWTARCADGTLRIRADGRLVEVDNFGAATEHAAGRREVLAAAGLAAHAGLGACPDAQFPALALLAAFAARLAGESGHALPDLPLMASCLDLLSPTFAAP